QALDSPSLFRPFEDDPRNRGRFRRVDPSRQSSGPARFQIPTYGNPPASGAGVSGFDSTNALRRKTRTATKPKPGARPALAQAVPTGERAVPIRPSFDPTRRGAATLLVPTETLVPVIVTPTGRRPAIDLDPFAPIGLRAGAFTLFPAVEFTGGYDTNPAHSSLNRGSSIFLISPELKLRSDWLRHQLNADIKGTYTAYGNTFGFNSDGSQTGTPNSLDRPNLDARVNGRLD